MKPQQQPTQSHDISSEPEGEKNSNDEAVGIVRRRAVKKKKKKNIVLLQFFFFFFNFQCSIFKKNTEKRKKEKNIISIINK